MTSSPGYEKAEARIFERHVLRPETHQLRLEKPRLTLRALEVGRVEPALFLHGFSHCTAHWAPLVSRLVDTRSIMIDMPGHGASDAVDYSGVDLRDWYESMLTSLPKRAPARLG